MTLTVEIKLNGKLIAGAKAENISRLADLSDYRLEIVEEGNESLGITNLHKKASVAAHPRRQSVWALVAKIAKASGRSDG